MTIEEVIEKYCDKNKYVNCAICPAYGGRELKCPLLNKEIPGKSADGNENCWEYIAKFMTEREAENIPKETASTIDHPSHYAGEKYECIEVMREVFGDEVVKAFCLGNAFKYLWRCKKKYKSPYEDIAKAIWYFEKHNSIEEGAKENGEQQTKSSAEGA